MRESYIDKRNRQARIAKEEKNKEESQIEE